MSTCLPFLLCFDCPIKLHQADRYQFSFPEPEGPCNLVFITIINTYRHLVVCKSLQWQGVYVVPYEYVYNTPIYCIHARACIIVTVYEVDSIVYSES